MSSPPNERSVSNELSGAASTRPTAMRRRTRNRATTACNTCRNRRTKCDNRKPACGYCQLRGIPCIYEQAANPARFRIETEIASIHEKLEYITRCLDIPRSIDRSPAQTVAVSANTVSEDDLHDVALSDEEKSPFQMLGTGRIMETLVMDRDIAHELLQLESTAPLVVQGNIPRLHMIQQQQAMNALATFSTQIHPWYPILPPDFSDTYLQTITGPLPPGSQSCLALIVTAIGFLVEQDYTSSPPECGYYAEQYFDAALSSLPALINDRSIQSVQCFFLFAVYHCCVLKPYYAYDYVVTASNKVQNLLKLPFHSRQEVFEQEKRVFWAILLLESELRAQLDVTDSGIWKKDETVPLPDGQQCWRFDTTCNGAVVAAFSPSSPENPVATDLSIAQTESYFLAEIAMRRMLHRCTTAIRRTVTGSIVYAPGIAQELELQLEEWYHYLPLTIRFSLEQDSQLDLQIPTLQTALDSLRDFLRVQFYCCKMSIYWPAVYECIQNEHMTEELSKGCERFLGAYIQLTPSILVSVRNCMVNRWTIFASIFMTTMTAMLAARSPCIRNGCNPDWARLFQCFENTRSVDHRIIDASPSLTLLAGVLAQRLNEIVEN